VKVLIWLGLLSVVVSGCTDFSELDNANLTNSYKERKTKLRQIIFKKESSDIGGLFARLQDKFHGMKILTPRQVGSQVTIIEWDNEDGFEREKAINELKQWDGVESITDDFRVDLEKRGSLQRSPMEEPYFEGSWHLDKIKVPNIWRQTTGNQDVVVAVVDLGFEQEHHEFYVSSSESLGDDHAWYINSKEIPRNRIDDDQNGLIDDVSGWNFAIESANLVYGSAPNHGTATASIVGGRINQRGGVGICPQCKILPLVIDDRISSIILAYQYLAQFSVAVVNNSWGFRLLLPEMNPLVKVIEEAHKQGRQGLGTGVVFAMSNEQRDDCVGGSPDISSLTSVIAVSGVSQNDRKIAKSGFGNCLDLVAPTSQFQEGGILAADRSGNKGVNRGDGSDLPDWDYTRKFYGTSAAAPQVAGALALIFSLYPEYSIERAQKILFERAKKIDPLGGSYNPDTGKSPLYGHGMVYLGDGND
jgi:subtilisin family serine protease